MLLKPAIVFDAFSYDVCLLVYCCLLAFYYDEKEAGDCADMHGLSQYPEIGRNKGNRWGRGIL